jgi:hypothetical protein
VLLLLRKSPEKLCDLFWFHVNPEVTVGEKEVEDGRMVKVNVDGRDFIGSDEQLPIFLKYLIAIASLMFKPGFAVAPGDGSLEKLRAATNEGGWTRSSKGNEFLGNRIALLETLLTLVLTEKKFAADNRYQTNSVLTFFRSWRGYLGFLRSLLQLSTSFEDVGVLSYSGFFFKEFTESTMYLSALSINLSLIFLAEETEVSKVQKANDPPIIPIFLVKHYLINQGLEAELDDEPLFSDEVFMTAVLERIVVHVLNFSQRSKGYLPQTLKDVA